MRALFLSDAHLTGPDDGSYPRLMAFFNRIQGRRAAGSSVADPMTVDQLIIAGDFFDFWFGRGDAVYPGFRPVIDRISALKGQGVRIGFCEGNHDFFLGEYFTGRLGMDVYPEWAEFEMDGLRVLVSHGDTVDGENRKYLALRRFLRSRFAYALQRSLPLGLLWRLARLSSEMSKKISGVSEDRMAETMCRFALMKFQEGYDAVVLGHCHKPLLCETMQEGRVKTFATLGDWVNKDTYLVCDEGRFSLKRFSPKGKDGPWV